MTSLQWISTPGFVVLCLILLILRWHHDMETFSVTLLSLCEKNPQVDYKSDPTNQLLWWHVLYPQSTQTETLTLSTGDPIHDDVTKGKHCLRDWPFVCGIHWSPVNSPHKGQWRGALIFPLICAWTNGWANNRGTGDLRRHRSHYDVTVMFVHFACSYPYLILLCTYIHHHVSVQWSWI